MKFSIPAMLLADGYKGQHARMYPVGMTRLLSTWTPRSDKIARMTNRQLWQQEPEVVFFGFTYAARTIVETFAEWFARPTRAVMSEMRDFYRAYYKQEAPDLAHVEALHHLGYLPLRVLHLPEGTVTRTGVVHFTIYNTHDDFAWLTNYVETELSNLMWGSQTLATIARNYRKLCNHWADMTCNDRSFVPWQCHDFSMRGMLGGGENAMVYNVGHLLFFNGTDTIPSLFAAEQLFNGFDKSSYGTVPATEHSVMCAGGADTELETFDRLLDLYPDGIVSIVSDTWDFWHVLTGILPRLKDKIMARNGKVVIRPDSGDPVDIICGDPNAEPGSPAFKGAIALLAEVFGQTVNAKGYYELDQHIGLIYGDSITLPRAEQIFMRLEAKGFASNNVVLGIGSYTYQCNTRDTWGFAMKATGATINGVEHALFKDPVTDDGTKKSFKGYCKTIYDPNIDRGNDANCYRTVDGLTFEDATSCSPATAGQPPNLMGDAFIAYDFRGAFALGGLEDVKPYWPNVVALAAA